MRSGRALFRCSMSVLAAIIGCAFATGCKIGFNEDVASAAFAKSRVIAGVTIEPGEGDEYAFTILNVPTVTLSSALPAASIFYSIDGSPYALYTGPFALAVDDPKTARTFTLSAYAADPEWNDSPVVSRRFAFSPTGAPPPVIDPALSVPYEYNSASVPTVTLSSALPGSTVRYAIDGVTAYADYTGPFEFPLPADLSGPSEMKLVAYCAHPDYLDSPIVSQVFRYVTSVPAPVIKPQALPAVDYSVASVPTVTISCAQSGASVYYSINGSAYVPYAAAFALPLPADTTVPSEVVVSAYATSAGYDDSSVSSQSYRFVPTVPTPTIAPATLPGGYYTVNSVPAVTVSCAQAGVSILYAINGGAYASYPGPFALPIPADPTAPADVVVTAYASYSGYIDSSVASQSYHFIPTVPSPSIAPPPARYYQYNAPPTITLSCTLAGAAINWQVDGLTSYAAYAIPFALPLPAIQTTSQDLTLRAYASNAGYADSLETALVYRFAATGSIVTLAGDGGSSFAGEGVDPVTVSLALPVGLAVDGTAAIYVADTTLHRVRKIDLATGLISTFAGTSGTSGYTGEDVPATSATLAFPTSLAVDNDYLYICDRGNNCVRRVSKTSNKIYTYVGMGPASPGYNGDGLNLAARMLNLPEAIMLDSNDKNLYIADTANNRIRKIVLADSEIFTVAGNGTAGYVADGVPATGTPLNHPRGIGMRQTTKFLYIGDTDNHRIRQVDPGTGLIATVAGTGTAGYTGEGNPLTAALSSPTCVAVDNTAVYISDTGNNRVRKIDTGVISTIAGTGVSGYSGDFGPATAAMVSSPAEIVPTSGGLFFADPGNGRVRKILKY